MALRGTAKNLHMDNLFEVQIDGVTDSSFAECSEISVELGKSVYESGGQALPVKQLNGKATVADVTLRRGVCDDYDLYLWFQECAALAASAAGAPFIAPASPYYKRNVDLVQKELDSTTKRRWTLVGTFPVKFVAGKWDAKSGQAVIEEMVLSYDYPQLKAA